MDANKRALVVEDNESVRTGVKRLLERYGCEVDTAANAAEGQALAAINAYCLIVSDNTMPPREGLAPERDAGLNLLSVISLDEQHKETALILYTGDDPGRLQSKAQEFGAYCVQKPSSDFLLLVRQILTGEK